MRTAIPSPAVRALSLPPHYSAGSPAAHWAARDWLPSHCFRGTHRVDPSQLQRPVYTISIGWQALLPSKCFQGTCRVEASPLQRPFYTISIGWWALRELPAMVAELQERMAAGSMGPLAPGSWEDRAPEPDKLHGAKPTLDTGSCSLEEKLGPSEETSPNPTQALNTQHGHLLAC